VTEEGVVLEGTGGVWRVRTTAGAEHDTSMRGRLKQDEKMKLAVGDHVTIERDAAADAWTIAAIHPRTTQLARRAPGGRYAERVVVANLDQVVVVFAAAKPEPHPGMIDRFLVIAESNDLAVRLVVNKIELTEPTVVDALVAPYEAAGYPVHRTSVKAGIGIEALHDVLAGRVSALTGPSGVGKSSLLNAIFPGVNLRVGEISESVNKGRHTTVGAKLVPLPENGYVVDTPGLREVGLWGISSEDVDQCFPEVRDLLGTCRFRDCQHDGEPGCAIRAAVAAGTIARARYQSYLKLRAELAESENVY
jgi:ribosome biogenesis GTPase / thiamine phosphate phosphatase